MSSLVAHPGLSHTNLQVATVDNAGTRISGRFWKVTARYVGSSPLSGTMPALRAATDLHAQNGEFYGPRWNVRGPAVKLGPDERRSAEADTARMWDISESLTGTVFSLGH